MVQATLSACQSGVGYIRARDSAAPAHLGALIAAKLRIQAMIQDAVSAGLLLQPPLEARLDAVIATATSTYLEALDDEDRATAKLYVQKAAQAADDAWQQTIGGHHGPSVTNPTMSDLEHSSSASQDEDSDDMDFSAPRKSRLSAPQLQAQFSWLTDWTRLGRLKNTLLSKGAWQQVTRIEDLCHTHVSHKWLYHFAACGKCPDAARLHHQRAEKTWEQGVDRILADNDCVAPFWTHSWSVERPAAPPKAHEDNYACTFMPCCVDSNSQTQASPPNPEGSQRRNPGRLIFSLPLLSQDAAPPWMCVASPNAAAARGDAAQAAFDRKLTDYRNEIPRSA